MTDLNHRRASTQYQYTDDNGISHKGLMAPFKVVIRLMFPMPLAVVMCV